jgi:hypothetical protein
MSRIRFFQILVTSKVSDPTGVRGPEHQSKLCPVEMVEEKWLKILEGPGTITLGVRFLAEMESWILQVSFRTFSYLLQTVLPS